jgi:hypothetical protein
MKWNFTQDCKIPAPANPFELILVSCANAMKIARDVYVDAGNLQEFAFNLDPKTVRSTMDTPDSISDNAPILNDFASVAAHVNYTLVFSLMEFGHGFRHALHAALGMGASKTMTLGVNHLAAEGDLDAQRLDTFSDGDVETYFQIPQSGELVLLRSQVQQVLSSTGSILIKNGYRDFFAFCIATLDSEEGNENRAANLTRTLANTFPAFCDVGVDANGAPVYLLKKAQLAIGELRRTVGTYDARFAFPDIADLRAIVDNVVPAMLVKYGILQLSNKLARIIQSRASLPRGAMETELRAGSVVACEKMVTLRENAFSNVELANYLWLLGKEGDNRQWERHQTQDTIYY